MKLKTTILVILVLALAGCGVEDNTPKIAPVVTIEMIEETEEVQSRYEKPEATKNSETIYEESETNRILTNDLCTGLAKEIFDATNDERQAVGLDPLIWDDELAKYANIRAEEIITNFDHIRNDGTTCFVLSDLIWAENIAMGPHATGAEFLEHWMASPSHKEAILTPEYRTIGVGVTCTEQGDTAVQLFGVDVVQ